jgi:hypothetical protein
MNRVTEPWVETTNLETHETTVVDLALHRSGVVRAEPVDHCFPAIRTLTE